MSGTDTANGGGAHEPRKEGRWRRLKAKLFGSRDIGLRESLEGAIETHEAQNPGESFKEEAKSMMLNIIEFASLRVDDVMVPRADIVAIEDTATMHELLLRFTEANHSRLPIYRESLDDIAGMVHVKDFMRWMSVKGTRRRKSKAAKPAAPSLSIPAAELALTVKQSGLHREVLFVPPSMPAADLLVRMQASHIHLAIVIDEYGGTDGLVSIEDLVEQIVGDISDEHDTDEENLIKPIGEGVYAADGRVDIEKLEELLGIDFLAGEEAEEADTLAGLVFKMAGRVPARGEIVRHGSGLEFEIVESDPRRVKRVKISTRNATVRAPAQPEPETGEAGKE
ncbi:MAG: hemolysin family protein [Hyphomicrobiales bacterium]